MARNTKKDALATKRVVSTGGQDITVRIKMDPTTIRLARFQVMMEEREVNVVIRYTKRHL